MQPSLLALDSTIFERLRNVRGIVSDLDGTLFLGKTVFPETALFVRAIRESGRKLLCLTNNSSSRGEEYAEKLRRGGVEVDVAEIYTSGDATVDYLRRIAPEARLFLLGTPSLEELFLEAGFQLVRDTRPDFVVLGFDKTLTYEKIDRAAYWLRRGVPFVATHADLVCPLENGEQLVDAGSMIAMFRAATGIRPRVIGKPHRTMLQGVVARLGLSKDEIALVGDRLTTDIRMARTFGIASVLVLTGEATLEDVEHARWKPDLVVRSVGDLAPLLQGS